MKNHNYKSARDVISAMINGQVFYFIGNSINTKIYYCAGSEKFKAGEELLLSFSKWKDWQIEPRWTDNLSHEHPVLCWVWSGGDMWDNPMMITSFDGETYLGYTSTHYFQAEPVKPEECWQSD